MGKLSAAAKVCEELRAQAVDADNEQEEEFRPWMPESEPQWQAVRTEAFETLYGGEPGSGKSAILLILATLGHKRSIIFRKTYTNLSGIVDDSRKLLRGSGAKYNDNKKRWRNIPGDRLLEFGTLQYEQDKENYRGIAHDFKGYDEITEISESRYEFTTGWTRTDLNKQRCRVFATCNPPGDKTGRWVVKRWMPWLDKRYCELKDLDGNLAKPAKSGEVRWFARLTIKDGNFDQTAILRKCPKGSFLLRVFKEYKQVEVEVPNGDIFIYNDEPTEPVSRTFIRARTSDNQYIGPDYQRIIDMMPEPMRSQLKYGDFSIGEDDQEWQVIPGLWVREAQSRWMENPQWMPFLTSVGCDVARGGADNTVLVKVHDWWVAPIIVHPGTATPDGWVVAEHCKDAANRNQEIEIRIDTVGVGSSPFDVLEKHGYNVISMSGGNKSVDADDNPVTDVSGTLCFADKRAEWWWNMRDLLNPVNGATLALPPDEDLYEELTTPRYFNVGRGGVDKDSDRWLTKIRVESKDDLRKADRLGRSPDKADALAYALAKVHQGGYDPTWAIKAQTATSQPLNVWR